MARSTASNAADMWSANTAVHRPYLTIAAVLMTVLVFQTPWGGKCNNKEMHKTMHDKMSMKLMRVSF